MSDDKIINILKETFFKLLDEKLEMLSEKEYDHLDEKLPLSERMSIPEYDDINDGLFPKGQSDDNWNNGTYEKGESLFNSNIDTWFEEWSSQ